MNDEEKMYLNNKRFVQYKLQLIVLSYIQNLLIQNNTALKKI